jgi:hypothetical protein
MKKKMLMAAAMLCVMAAGHAAAQDTRHPGYKDPGTSTLLSVLVPGGGQLYSGETGKGAALLGVGLGGLTLGVAMTAGSVGSSCSETSFSCKDDTNYLPMALGYVAYLGSWIYGIIDAGDSARRMNARHGLSGVLPDGVTPMLTMTSTGGAGVGVNVRF